MFKIYKPIGDNHYQRIVVKDPTEYLDNGWYMSIADHKVPVNEPQDYAAPTREEMEIKADELGIWYDGRTSDKKLLERITEALK
jgi:hypothetical protein